MNADFGCVYDGEAAPGGNSTSAASSALPGTFGSSCLNSGVIRLLELDPTLRCPLRVGRRRSGGEDSRAGGKKCMLHLEGSVSSSAEPLLLGPSRRGAEADC